MLERSDYGKHRQHKAMTVSRPFADGKHLDHTRAETAFRSAVAGSISQRLRGKHFSSLNCGKHQQYCWHFAALSPEAFHIVKVDGKHQHMLAFRSAFAGSISHRQGGREASAYCWLFEQICFVFCFLFVFGCVCVCVADWFWQKASL